MTGASPHPSDLASRLDDAELVHEVMEHRWYASERVGHDVGLATATDDYVASILVHRPLENDPILSPNVDDGMGVGQQGDGPTARTRAEPFHSTRSETPLGCQDPDESGRAGRLVPPGWT